MKQSMPKTKPPYRPKPFREGNTLIRLFEVDYEDTIGNKAVITKADYIEKKGTKKEKLIENYILYVKWH